ncbi:MAG: pyroglutamyl-peptidase I [Lentisphaeria bacterium]|nr:pyroglutamyl-peptidase I [Lentisphaeria bacterium]
MPIALLSGFDCWGGSAVNTSWAAVEAAAPSLAPGWTVRKVMLPVSWTRGPVELAAAWSADVGAVIACGMADITAIHVEQIAINLTGPGLADVDGLPPPSPWVIPDGPPAYFSGLPVTSLCEAMLKSHIPAVKSPHCGTYLCDFIFYWLMHKIHSERLGIPGGFLHIPSPASRLDPATLARGVAIATELSVARAPSGQCEKNPL